MGDNAAIINCHALAEDKEDQTKEDFFNHLQRVCDSGSHRT